MQYWTAIRSRAEPADDSYAVRSFPALEKEGGGQKYAGRAFVAGGQGSGKFGGKRSIPRDARRRGGLEKDARRGQDRGENERNKSTRKKRMNKPPTAIPATEMSTTLKATARSATVVVRSTAKRCNVPDRCVVFVAEKVIRLKSAPTSSLSLRVKLTGVISTSIISFAENSKRSSSAVH